MNLQGKRVVVTGANGALGHAVVARSRELGATVIGLDIHFDGHEADTERREVVDLTDKQATEACFARIGAFDVIFNVAGGFAMSATAYEIASPQ